jgi:uncharacterized protein
VNILITGGTGFIGRALVRDLLRQEFRVTVLVRDYAAARLKLGVGPELVRSLDEIDAAVYFDCVFNLAGAGIADQRWSLARKQVLVDSRVQTTRALVHLFHRLQRAPACLLSASAVGFYGAGRDEKLTEKSAGNSEFTHDLCRHWEEAARAAEACGTRVCLLRLGVVLGPGGMLARLLPFYRFWLGGKLGDGKQMLSWIHRDDVIAIMVWLMKSQLDGIFNVTAPEPVSNQEFNNALAAALRRPAVFTQPATIVQLMFGEMGDRLLLNGQQVIPQRLLEHGYAFRYPDLHSALQACLCDLRLN